MAWAKVVFLRQRDINSTFGFDQISGVLMKETIFMKDSRGMILYALPS